jgi:hypothetical protein
MTTGNGRLTVTLVDAPVDVYRRARQHVDDLLRELILMAGHEGVEPHVARLARDARDHDGGRAVLDDPAALARAEADGVAAVTLALTLDLADAASPEAWTKVLDDLAGLCRSGSMLSVPASDDVAAFVRWYCAEIVAQVRDGAAPTPWPARP